MPQSRTDDESATGDASTATETQNPIAANTSDATHPVAWIDAAGDAVDVAETAATLEHPYLDVAAGTLAEVVGRELGMDQGRAAEMAVPFVEKQARRFL